MSSVISHLSFAVLCAGVSVGAVADCGGKTSLDGAWKFSLNGGEARDVSVPHDWSIELPTDAKAPSEGHGGFYLGGTGVYERVFSLDAADLAKELELVFDGVYRDAVVEVNGKVVARGSRYGYTGFSVPLEPGDVKVGENTLRVTAVNDSQPNCRWYSGSGIYRHVWLAKRAKGTKVEDVAVETTLEGHVTVYGKVGGVDRVKTWKVENPVLWTPETPKLYEFDFYGEKLKVGIRTFTVDHDRGLLLNGKPVKLHGACVHHDHGPLGAASHDAAELRKVRQLKAGGFNAVRTSHNPVAEAFLDACDAEGIIVLDDMFDGWRDGKTRSDYARCFEEDWTKDIAWTVRRDRRHASVAMWSIGNEILERTSKRAVEDSRRAVMLCHQLDPSRPVTMALCSWGGEKQWLEEDELAATLDIAGYNYMEWMTEKDRERVPDRVIVYTETNPRDSIDVWRRIVRHPYVIGEFVWTGIDYLGEASIGRAYYKGSEVDGEHFTIAGTCYPWHGGCCGDIDVTGWRRPVSHRRETLWNADAPTYLAVREPDGWKGEIKMTGWSVWPTWERWNFEGWEGKTITAEICSRAVRVRLSLNGKTIGEKENGSDNAYLTTFELVYEPGELVAEGLDADGRVLDSSVLKTAGEPASVRFSRETIGDLTWVVAEVVDSNGVVCPDAKQDVTFEGDVLATASGDLRDTVPAPSRTRRTSHGRAMAVVRSEAISVPAAK